MIRLLFKIPLALLLLAPGAWGLSLVLHREPGTLLHGARDRLAWAYPGAAERAFLIREAERRAARWEAGLPPVARPGGRLRGLLREGLFATALQGRILGRLLPAIGLGTLAALLLGLAARERLRGEEGYASPAGCALGRLAVAGGGLLLGLLASAPVPLPPGGFYVPALVFVLGVGLYVANLPLGL